MKFNFKKTGVIKFHDDKVSMLGCELAVDKDETGVNDFKVDTSSTIFKVKGDETATLKLDPDEYVISEDGTLIAKLDRKTIGKLARKLFKSQIKGLIEMKIFESMTPEPMPEEDD